MRVAVLVKEFPPDVVAGTETQTKRMARELVERGDHEVTVYTKAYGDDRPVEEPYEVVRVPNLRTSPFASTLTFCLVAFLYLLRDAPRFDVLHCMMIYPTGFVGYLVNRLRGLPYFAWIRGGDYYFMKDTPGKRRTIATVLADTLVLVQTERIARDVRREFPDADLEVLGNGVDLPAARSDGDRIVFVGRLEAQKGVDVLLRAMDGIEEPPPLLVVGDGSARAELESLAADLRVDAEFVGQVSPETVVEYLCEGKLFVLPSIRGEGLPNALLEAMAVGLPAVVTDTGGVADAVVDGETGRVVDPGDEAALREAIEWCLADGERLEAMGENAREYVAERHSWPVIVDRVTAVYERVTGRE